MCESHESISAVLCVHVFDAESFTYVCLYTSACNRMFALTREHIYVRICSHGALIRYMRLRTGAGKCIYVCKTD